MEQLLFRINFKPGISRKKEEIINNLLQKLDGRKLLDLGANEGFFSSLAAAKNFDVVAIDKDEQCINVLYKKVTEENITNILPLCMDLMNPSSASGFANNERASFGERIHTMQVMALALVHHLAIGYNLPLKQNSRVPVWVFTSTDH
jgi:ribosomal protein L11 methylase PrmA